MRTGPGWLRMFCGLFMRLMNRQSRSGGVASVTGAKRLQKLLEALGFTAPEASRLNKKFSRRHFNTVESFLWLCESCFFILRIQTWQSVELLGKAMSQGDVQTGSELIQRSKKTMLHRLKIKNITLTQRTVTERQLQRPGDRTDTKYLLIRRDEIKPSRSHRWDEALLWKPRDSIQFPCCCS